MNKWELQYHQFIMSQPGVVSAAYEPLTLRLADRTGYTPDFLVVMSDGSVQFHEVKGFSRDDAIVKFKVAAELYHKNVFVMVHRSGGSWEEMFRLNDGDKKRSRKPKPKADPPLVAKSRQVGFSSPSSDRPPQRMSYGVMSQSPEHQRVLKMKPREFLALRVRLGKSCEEMDMLVGLPKVGTWEKFENGSLSIYHQRHVEAVGRLL
jgi:hypothetical protein